MGDGRDEEWLAVCHLRRKGDEGERVKKCKRRRRRRSRGGCCRFIFAATTLLITSVALLPEACASSAGSGGGVGGGNLPSGWSQHSYKGRFYYYNANTGESTWEAPVPGAMTTTSAAEFSAWTEPSTSPSTAVGGDSFFQQGGGYERGGYEQDHERVEGNGREQEAGTGTGIIVEEEEPSWNEVTYELPDWGSVSSFDFQSSPYPAERAGNVRKVEEVSAARGTSIAADSGSVGVLGGTDDGILESREELQRLRTDNEALRKEVERERLLVDASASNLTALIGELVQAVTDRADLQGNCTTLRHELANATMVASRLGRHLSVAKVHRAQLAEEVEEKNAVIKSLESRLEDMVEDVRDLDKALAQYMEGGGPPNPLSWTRFRKTVLEPLVPQVMKSPTADEALIEDLRREVKALKENNTALAESLDSKADLIAELNHRIAGFEDDSVKRRQSLAGLKTGIDDLTLEVEQKKEQIEIVERNLEEQEVQHQKRLGGVVACAMERISLTQKDLRREREVSAELRRKIDELVQDFEQQQQQQQSLLGDITSAPSFSAGYHEEDRGAAELSPQPAVFDVVSATIAATAPSRSKGVSFLTSLSQAWRNRSLAVKQQLQRLGCCPAAAAAAAA